MGAWKQVLFRMRLIFAGNGSDQTGSADFETEKIKRHASNRPHRATGLEREVLILVS